MGKGNAAPVSEWREEAGQAVWCVKEVTSNRKAPIPTVTREEVAKHCTKDDCWIIIYDKVYDMSKWVDHHPGGYLPLVNIAGRDATDNFLNYHPAYVWTKKLPWFLVAKLSAEEAKPSPLVQDYRQLRQSILEAGLMETRYSYYYKLCVWLASLFALGLYLTMACESTLAHMAGAVTMGMFFQQVAFVGHDIGHNGVTHEHAIDSSLGLIVGNLLTGISMGWWKWSHNTHHNVCNSVENDPDVQYLPLFAVSNKFLRQFYSTFHKKVFSFDSAARFLISYQHLLFYPVMCVARVNLYIQSVLFIITTKVPTVNKVMETLCLVLYFAWFGALVSTIPGTGQRVAYVVLSHAVTGLLHVQITLSHFSMPTYHGLPLTGDDLDSWSVLQIATSLDVSHPWYMEWFHGGLQYQVEHHLFPRIPRHNLALIRPMVQAFCKRHGIKYNMASFFDANVLLMSALKQAATEAASSPLSADSDEPGHVSAVQEFTRSALWDGIQARG